MDFLVFSLCFFFVLYLIIRLESIQYDTNEMRKTLEEIREELNKK